MSSLTDKAILIISPQPWDHIPLSKHNYARALAYRGNTVFFLGPPDAAMTREISVQPVAGIPGLSTVSIGQSIPSLVRFHARPVYDRLMRTQMQRIARSLGRALDVVWSFDFNLYMDLKGFGAPLAIYHVADPVSTGEHVAVARSADAVFTVSESIRSAFRQTGVPSWSIGHALASEFTAELDDSASGRDAEPGHHVGYAGNLVHPAVNHAIIRQCIEENPSVRFHFWGPRDRESFQLEVNATEITEFVSFLERRGNVRLHGAVSHIELSLDMRHMDCLLLSYKSMPNRFDKSNSHKMLEYLSTGKTVIASRLAEYAQRDDLVRMPPGDDDAEIPALLRDTLDHIEELNSAEMRSRRREFALAHTYERQIERIERCLDSINK